MGVFDKIKNALFEVEYVEVDEPVKEKKKKPKDNDEDNSSEKPIAKKIVLPGKREEKIKKIQEEELVDQNFEARPKDENIKEEDNSSFRFMDDADFKVEDEPVIIRSIDEVEVLDDNSDVVVPNIDGDRVVEPTKKVEETSVNAYRGVSPIQNDTRTLSTLDSSYRIKERESRPYGMDPSYRVSIKEYGVYDSKDDKDGFKPSPIISPIYGILDKNYKKEDVVTKKEVRITSNYTRRNMNVDDIRNKAYGKDKKEEDKVELPADLEKAVEEEKTDETLLVDLSDEKEKPEVKEITVGDAMEYFQDLGLEYNVDYVDASNKSNKAKTEETEELTEEKEEEIPVPAPVPVEENTEPVVEEPIEEKKEVKEEVNVSPVEVIHEDKEEVLDDDNLFDLIDSMYKDNN